MNILLEYYKINFSKNSTAMVVIEGYKVQGYRFQNCIMLNPYSISSYMEENLLIHGLLKDLSKMDGSTDIITFISSLTVEKNL